MLIIKPQSGAGHNTILQRNSYKPLVPYTVSENRLNKRWCMFYNFRHCHVYRPT